MCGRPIVEHTQAQKDPAAQAESKIYRYWTDLPQWSAHDREFDLSRV